MLDSLYTLLEFGTPELINGHFEELELETLSFRVESGRIRI